MDGFSSAWLALREPVDHRSRNPELASALSSHFAGRAPITVVDLGCGTGSNVRATSALLSADQSWMLVDYDAHLLAAARVALLAWADRVTSPSDPDASVVAIEKHGKRLSITFRQADLNRQLDTAIPAGTDLVTASAFFDLCSADFLRRVAAIVAQRRAAFYTVLTYNGLQTWQPTHEADARLAAAFHAHQQIDKGFGRAAGPMAAAELAEAFCGAGYRVREADSPWRLGAADRPLIDQLAAGFASAVGATDAIARDVLADWVRQTRTAAVVGHTDTLALP